MMQEHHAPATQTLVTGMLAPAFHVEDAFGTSVALEGYAGNPLLLSFFRNGACALCNLQVHKLIERYPAYHRQGLAVIAVFESPRESILRSVGRQDAPFPIIPDPQGALYARYGIENSAEKVKASMTNPSTEEARKEAEESGFPLTAEEGSNFFRMTADFLIAPDQTIVEAKYADFVGDHLSFATIEQFLVASGRNGAA